MDPTQLAIGDHHYMAYVGSPALYDIAGASQFRLLCTLGLRADHKVLDFGCGSLRAGRFFIPYLNEGSYFGIDPNEWLIQDAIENQIGQDLVRIKKPAFNYNDDFTTGNFAVQFDFIIAQSIFTHTGIENTRKGLQNFSHALQPNGVIAVSFREGSSDYPGSDWVYPEVVPIRRPTIHKLAQEAGLFVRAIPWYHPKVSWYLFAKQKNRLPNRAMLRHLQGAILFDPEHLASWAAGAQLVESLRRWVKRNTSIENQEKIQKLVSRLVKSSPKEQEKS